VPGNSEDYSWDEELNDWQHVSNTTYSYNNAGKLTEEISRDAETNYYLTRNTYSDNPNYIMEEVSYTWIIDGWIPVAGERSSKTLSAESPFEGYNNGILYQTLENEVWVNKTWIKYILDQRHSNDSWKNTIGMGTTGFCTAEQVFLPGPTGQTASWLPIQSKICRNTTG
jgi:hypothetical protein